MKKPSFLSFFRKKEAQENIETQEQVREREYRELLRENLALVPIDIYYIDDPLVGVPPDKRLVYLEKFHKLVNDKDIMEWFKYLINRQVRNTMQTSMDSISDKAGAYNINGIATVRDKFQKLASMYQQESVPEQEFNQYKII